MNRRALVEDRVESQIDHINVMMSAYSLDAADHGKANGLDLDFSEDSIRAVEEVLGKLERDRPKGITKLLRKGLSPEELETVCKMYGAYIGEVMRLEWGVGEWVIPEDGPFAGALVLQYGGSMTSPPAKVYKRIMDGPGDDVWCYYQVLKAGLEEEAQ